MPFKLCQMHFLHFPLNSTQRAHPHSPFLRLQHLRELRPERAVQRRRHRPHKRPHGRHQPPQGGEGLRRQVGARGKAKDEALRIPQTDRSNAVNATRCSPRSTSLALSRTRDGSSATGRSPRTSRRRAGTLRRYTGAPLSSLRRGSRTWTGERGSEERHSSQRFSTHSHNHTSLCRRQLLPGADEGAPRHPH